MIVELILTASIGVPAALTVVMVAYHRGFDQGWIQRHLHGPRRPWDHGQSWRGNRLTRSERDDLELSPDDSV